jgi:hypothetical protein
MVCNPLRRVCAGGDVLSGLLIDDESDQVFSLVDKPLVIGQ